MFVIRHAFSPSVFVGTGTLRPTLGADFGNAMHFADLELAAACRNARLYPEHWDIIAVSWVLKWFQTNEPFKSLVYCTPLRSWNSRRLAERFPTPAAARAARGPAWDPKRFSDGNARVVRLMKKVA